MIEPVAVDDGLLGEILILAKKHKSTSPSSPPSPISICKIPNTLRNVKPRAYCPRVVSIGLNHPSATEKIRNMDEHTEIYMASLFQRTVPPYEGEPTQNDMGLFDETVRLCVESMKRLADAAGKCYPVSPHCLDPKITARTMLLDGCFIIELLIRCYSARNSKAESITGGRLKLNSITYDLLLLENQLPFFILEELYTHTVSRFPPNHASIPPLKELILKFFGNKLNPNFELKIKRENNVVDHILGLLHSCYQPGESHPGDYQISKYSANELHRSGVSIKPGTGNKEVYLHVEFKTPCLFSWFATIYDKTTQLLPVSKSVKNIRCCVLSFMCQFSCRATLEIPVLCVTDSTESFMRNLIAYEQCSQNIPRYITSYAFLMDTLINSKEHVEMLETSGVLKNYLGSGEDASNLFNSFGNPWTSISLFAALILFAFTGLQTICSVISTW